jgi:3-hydroxybutyrate dehydrogenase
MQNVHFDFTGRTALVTGGASGMGAAIARIFAEAGANVVVVDLNRAAAEATARSLGPNTIAVAGDVSE